ncbi:MAG: class I SAM-dependent methyltransferase [Tractidigestivibacter sp.]|uniref:class I SAM-dependent methyltransferase n=1 Tax=Tractidigestivibacter sp. TaxID=2847320 RepID=UPI003D9283E5
MGDTVGERNSAAGTPGEDVDLCLGRREVATGVELVRTGEGLALSGDGMVLRGDFSRMLPRLRKQNLAHELVVRAARIRGVAAEQLRAIDATAGLGEDALLLAAAGFSVTMYERDPAMAALLEDALARAARDSRLADAVSRMELRKKDSIPELLRLATSSEDAPDIVLLDPMFPERKKSAAVKKKLQLIQRLEAPCSDEAELLDAAIAAGPRKVLIKRPAKGPWLAGRKPSYSLSGKAIRYDVIALGR